MNFRVGITFVTLIAALPAGIASADLFADGRPLIALTMALTSGIIATIAFFTWRWSGQAYPVKGIHYFD